MFVLLYLECQLIEGNSDLALDVINDISKHFQAILPHSSLKQILLNNRRMQSVMTFLSLQRHERQANVLMYLMHGIYPRIGVTNLCTFLYEYVEMVTH